MSNLVFIGDLEKYKQEIATGRLKQYQRLLEQADRYDSIELPDQHPPTSTTYMGIAIVNLALAYRLSGQEKYLLNAKRVMSTVISYEKWGNAHLVNVDLSASWILFGLSLGYDWLKEFLTESERAQISRKIQHHAKIIFDYRRETYGKGWSTNFFQNHNWINMNGLATAGYVLAKEDVNATAYIQEAKDDFRRVFTLMADDGSNYEGVVYWRYGGMWLFVYAHLLKVQEGIDYFHTSKYLKNTFYYRLYQSAGDFRQQMNYGDCHDRYSGHTACVYYKTAAEYGDGYAQALGNLVVDKFLQGEHENSKVKPGIFPEAAFEFLWYDPSVAEKSLSDLPLTRYFDDIGLLAMRSSWMEDAKVLTIKCSPPGGKKQWEEGWKIYENEQIDLFSLSHHHPDNLSYILNQGSQFFTCEDGYNRNIMADNHNVLLVDGVYTDAQDVNDVYMSSVKLRKAQSGGSFIPADYQGFVRNVIEEDGLVLYRAETAGVYPKNQKMREVSRTLITDGMKFLVFADVFYSDEAHIYSTICNTDQRATESGGNFRYCLGNQPLIYQIFSDQTVAYQQYNQHVTSVMTTQEPDKKCEVNIQTLAAASEEKQYSQVFFEYFTFADHPCEIQMQDRSLCLYCDGKTYRVDVGKFDAFKQMTPIRVSAGDKNYYL